MRAITIGSKDLELVKEAFEILIEDIENDLVDNSKTSQYRQKLLTELDELTEDICNKLEKL